MLLRERSRSKKEARRPQDDEEEENKRRKKRPRQNRLFSRPSKLLLALIRVSQGVHEHHLDPGAEGRVREGTSEGRTSAAFDEERRRRSTKRWAFSLKKNLTSSARSLSPNVPSMEEKARRPALETAEAAVVVVPCAWEAAEEERRAEARKRPESRRAMAEKKSKFLFFAGDVESFSFFSLFCFSSSIERKGASSLSRQRLVLSSAFRSWRIDRTCLSASQGAEIAHRGSRGLKGSLLRNQPVVGVESKSKRKKKRKQSWRRSSPTTTSRATWGSGSASGIRRERGSRPR